MKKKKKSAKTRSELLKFVQRYEAVRELLRHLESGASVSLQKLSAVLGKHAEKEFNEAWESERSARKYLQTKPDAVSSYEKKLRVADLIFGRAEKLAATAQRRKQINGGADAVKIKAMYSKAETRFESALEQLEADFGRDESLGQWFDRVLDFAAGSGIGPDIHSVPRTKSSRSPHNKNVQFVKNGKNAGKNTVVASVAQQSKTGIKRDIVQRELDKINEIYSALENTLVAARAAKVEAGKQQTEKVKGLLARLKTVR